MEYSDKSITTLQELKAHIDSLLNFRRSLNTS